MPTQTDLLAQLAATDRQPDATMTLRRAQFDAMLYDGGSAQLAEFTGIGYALGVYLTQDLDGYVVAPSQVGGPPAAMAEAETRWFYNDRLSDAYVRACLWALNEVAQDVAAEEGA